MKIKEIIGNLSEVVGRKLNRKKDAEGLTIPGDELDQEMDTKTPEGNKSMLKGQHETILGISKPVVTGIVIFFFLVFGLAFFYAASDDSGQTEKKTARVEDIADPSRVQGGASAKLSDDYGALERANAAHGRAPGQNGQNGQKNPQAQNPAAPPMETQQNPETVQAIPQQPGYAGAQRPSVVVPAPGGAYSQGYALPSQQRADEETQRKREEERNAAERLKEQLKSAIAFAFEGKTQQDAGSASDGADSASPANDNNAARGNNVPTRNSASTYTEPSDRTVMAGTLIPAMLMTGINTDAPGPVIAQVMADVYDVNGINLIIPAGSRVLGTIGQLEGSSGGKNSVSGRIGISFDTVVLPNGGSWNIGKSMMAVDGIGYSGVNGKLHRHTGSNFMKGLFNSALTALSTLAVDRVTLDASAFTALTDTQAPTATVAPGYTFNIYVTQNIAF